MQWWKKQYNSRNMQLIFSFVTLPFHATEEISRSILTLNSQSLNLCLKDLPVLESSDCSLEPHFLRSLCTTPVTLLTKKLLKNKVLWQQQYCNYFQWGNCKLLLFTRSTAIAIIIPTSATQGFQKNVENAHLEVLKADLSPSNCVFWGKVNWEEEF